MAYDDYLGAERARMQQPQAPAYMFRDDRQAELDRAQGAQTAAMGAAVKAAGPFAPAKPGTGFDSFTKDLEAGAPTAAKASGSNPFAPADTKGQVSGAISRLLANPTGGFDQQAALARQGAVKKDQQANEDLRSAAALQFLPGTGQAFAPVQQQTDAQRLAMRDFDLQTAGARADAERQGLGTGISAGLQQEGQRISAEQAAQALAETQRQFNETMPIQAAQARTAAEQGQQSLDLQRELGLGNLGLSKEKLAFDKQIGLGNLSLAQQQVANQASQYATDLDFKKYALQKGLDEHQADLAWQSNQKEIERKWTSGERLSSQEFTALINKNNQAFEEAQNALSRTLQLDLQGNAQKFEAAQTAAAQAYNTARQEAGFSHDQAMQASTQAFTKAMQEAGFSQEQSMQAAQLAQQANLAKQQMDLQETLHMADLAQSDRQFGQRLGLDYDQLQQHRLEFSAELSQRADQFAQTFGLQSEQVKAAMARDEVQDAMERVTIGLELSKDNPAAMQALAGNFAQAMGRALGFTPEQIAAGMAAPLAKVFQGGTTTPAPTIDTVQGGLDALQSYAGKMKAGTNVAALEKKVSQMGAALASPNIDPLARYSVIMTGAAPLVQAGLDRAAVKKVAPFLTADDIEIVFNQVGA